MLIRSFGIRRWFREQERRRHAWTWIVPVLALVIWLLLLRFT